MFCTMITNSIQLVTPYRGTIKYLKSLFAARYYMSAVKCYRLLLRMVLWQYAVCSLCFQLCLGP